MVSARPDRSSRPTPRPPAVQAVLDELLSRIELGVLLPGEQFRQEDLAESLGVSRAPVREALRVLEHDGVAEHHPNRGYFVARRSADELRQIFRMLELLEGELCARLVWPDDAALDALGKTNASFEAVAELDDPGPAVALNRTFHHQLFALAPDNLVRTEVERLWTLAAPAIAAGLVAVDARDRSGREHRAILEELRGRRRLGLLRAVEAHRADEGRGLDDALSRPAERSAGRR